MESGNTTREKIPKATHRRGDWRSKVRDTTHLGAEGGFSEKQRMDQVG